MISMTTDSVLPRERAEFWAALVSRHLRQCASSRRANSPAREVQARVIGDLRVAQVSGLGVHALHTGAQDRTRSRSPLCACVHLEARPGSAAAANRLPCEEATSLSPTAGRSSRSILSDPGGTC